jgi:hypothetical protein
LNIAPSKFLSFYFYNIIYRQRFGLFSQPVSNAIGETNRFPRKKANRDPEDGKPIIGPRNFYTRPVKKGRTDGIYFSKQSYVAVGDPYQQLSNVGLRTTLNDEARKLKGGHDHNFKPAKNTRERLYTAKYNYQPLMENTKKKNYRDEEGNVILGPRNFTAIPIKKGKVGRLTSFGGVVPYIADPYDNKKKIAWAELKDH